MELESLGPLLRHAPWFGREEANTKPLTPKITFNKHSHFECEGKE